MKKLTTLVLALALAASLAVPAFAASTTTLTTTVPAATYTLNIPADQEIPFGATETKIGSVNVTDSAGFASEKNLIVTLAWEDFKSESTNTTIPFYLEGRAGTKGSLEIKSGDTIKFEGTSSGTVNKYSTMELVSYQTGNTYTDDMTSIYFRANSTYWGKALGGDYSATITFTAEVVSG